MAFKLFDVLGVGALYFIVSELVFFLKNRFLVDRSQILNTMERSKGRPTIVGFIASKHQIQDNPASAAKRRSRVFDCFLSGWRGGAYRIIK